MAQDNSQPFFVLADLDFGTAHEALSGWAAPEAGRRWAVGPRSRVVLPRPPGPAPIVLLIAAEPCLFPPVLERQSLRVLVNGRTVRYRSLRAPSAFACLLDDAALGETESLDVVFEHPDVVRPNMVSTARDSRGRSVAFHRLTVLRANGTLPAARPAAAPGRVAPELPPESRLSDPGVMQRFASLGDNCEFGIAQRAYGAEPMDLLRFAGAPPPALLAGLPEGFASLLDLEHFEFELLGFADEPEWVLYHRRYSLQWHTGVHFGEMPFAKLYARQMKRLALLLRLFVEDIASGERIFVIKHNSGLGPDALEKILAALQAWGPNTLLHVRGPETGNPPGTVAWARPGLLEATIDAFSPYTDAARTPTDIWLTICRKAYELWRTEQARALQVASV